MLRIFSFIFILISFSTHAQIGVGQWRDHLPYRYTIDVCEGNNNLIYCATPNALFTYNKEDSSVERIFKGHGISDTDIKAIAFNKENNSLVVGYLNGNIDVVTDGKVANISDLRDSDLLADKQVNDIYLFEDKAYVSCGFGIVVVDILKEEISDTYYIASDTTFAFVNDLERSNEHWYAATNNGVYTASVNSLFLSNHTSWTKMTDLIDNEANYIDVDINEERVFLLKDAGSTNDRSIFYKNLTENSDWFAWDLYQNYYIRSILLLDESICVNSFGSFGEYDLDLGLLNHNGGYFDLEMKADEVIQDSEGIFWFANEKTGLGGSKLKGGEVDLIKLRTPYNVRARNIDVYNNNIWIASGGVSSAWVSTWKSNGLYGLVDETWYNSRDFDDRSFVDVLDVTINPNNTDEVYAGSYHEGLIQIKDKKIVNVFDETNSTLEVTNYEAHDFTGVASVDFDQDGNLWFTSMFSDFGLHVRRPNGDFIKFDLSPQITAEDRVINVFADSKGLIWIFIRGNGILVFDYNGTINDSSDDQFKLLSTEEGNGALPSEYCFSITEDLDGEIWIGSQKGPAIFYTPETIFTEEEFDAQQILITQDGNAQLLLETEVITGIAIDGGNRKWLATQNSGAYLFSSDGTNQLRHFTQENSPLFSNGLSDIGINHDNGEVYFVTERGVISYKGDATNFYKDMDDVMVFPNPVRPDYDGTISIDGLAQDADVKITDIEGNIIYHAIAEGGRAIWNGKRFDGTRPASGVYLVFVSNDDGSSTTVTKIAFVN